MPAALEVAQLNKRFGRTLAVADVNVTIEAGSAVALFGPNGAGKTTFMRLCATLLRPSGGTIRVAGLDTNSHGPAVRRRIAMLAHDSFLYPDLSPTENLLFCARLFRVARPQERIRALIDRMGLIGWAHRPVRTLSRGLLQRCALARVLLHKPEVLFLDEPFTGLDLDARETLCDVLAEAHRDGTTLLMSTHELATGFSLCSKALVLVRGRLVWDGAIAPHDLARFDSQYRTLIHRPPDQSGNAAASGRTPSADD